MRILVLSCSTGGKLHSPVYFANSAYAENLRRYIDEGGFDAVRCSHLFPAEAAVKNVPMIHVGAIPGCETKNAEFFARNGMSLMADTEAEAGVMAAMLSKSEEKRAAMLSAQRETVYPEAAGNICDYILRGGGERA